VRVQKCKKPHHAHAETRTDLVFTERRAFLCQRLCGSFIRGSRGRARARLLIRAVSQRRDRAGRRVVPALGASRSGRSDGISGLRGPCERSRNQNSKLFKCALEIRVISGHSKTYRFDLDSRAKYFIYSVRDSFFSDSIASDSPLLVSRNRFIHLEGLEYPADQIQRNQDSIMKLYYGRSKKGGERIGQKAP